MARCYWPTISKSLKKTPRRKRGAKGQNLRQNYSTPKHQGRQGGWQQTFYRRRLGILEHLQPGDREISLRDAITILRGQLTVIRTRAEQGLPVSVASIIRAENLARSLEERTA
jgi:hypothetical protein